MGKKGTNKKNGVRLGGIKKKLKNASKNAFKNSSKNGNTVQTTPRARESLSALGVKETVSTLAAAKVVIKSVQKFKTRFVNRILSISETSIGSCTSSEITLWQALSMYSDAARKMVRTTTHASALAKKGSTDQVINFSDDDFRLYVAALFARCQALTKSKTATSVNTHLCKAEALYQQKQLPARANKLELCCIEVFKYGVVKARNDPSARSLVTTARWLKAQKALCPTLKVLKQIVVDLANTSGVKLSSARDGILAGEPDDSLLKSVFNFEPFVLQIQGAAVFESEQTLLTFRYTVLGNVVNDFMEGAQAYTVLAGSDGDKLMHGIVKKVAVQSNWDMDKRASALVTDPTIKEGFVAFAQYINTTVEDACFMGLHDAMAIRIKPSEMWPEAAFARELKKLSGIASEKILKKCADNSVAHERQQFLDNMLTVKAEFVTADPMNMGASYSYFQGKTKDDTIRGDAAALICGLYEEYYHVHELALNGAVPGKVDMEAMIQFKKNMDPDEAFDGENDEAGSSDEPNEEEMKIWKNVCLICEAFVREMSSEKINMTEEFIQLGQKANARATMNEMNQDYHPLCEEINTELAKRVARIDQPAGNGINNGPQQLPNLQGVVAVPANIAALFAAGGGAIAGGNAAPAVVGGMNQVGLQQNLLAMQEAIQDAQDEAEGVDSEEGEDNGDEEDEEGADEEEEDGDEDAENGEEDEEMGDAE